MPNDTTSAPALPAPSSAPRARRKGGRVFTLGAAAALLASAGCSTGERPAQAASGPGPAPEVRPGVARQGGKVDGAKARQLVQGGALLLDVRTPEEFAEGHVEGALNIPVQELDARLGELTAKERPVVIYCRSGRRSASAAQMLEGAGFQAVYDLGPMTAW